MANYFNERLYYSSMFTKVGSRTKIRSWDKIMYILWLEDSWLSHIILSLHIWEKEFIPTGISNQVLQCNNNIHKKKSYAINLKTNNFENNLYYTINNTKISNSSILSKFLYTNVNNTWKHPIMKLVSAISNHKRKSNNQEANISIFTYKNAGYIVSLNDWENIKYFTVFFSFLFFFNTRNHKFATSSSK